AKTSKLAWKISTLRPTLSPSLINQEIIKLPSTLDRSNKPTRSCATTCPRVTSGASIFRWDFPSSQCACTLTASATDGGNCLIHPLQLLFKPGTTLKKHSVNPLSQVHKCFNAHL